MGKGTQRGFWGEEAPIERERIVEELNTLFHSTALILMLVSK